MNRSDINKIYERYKDGNSTLKEEELLFNDQDSIEPPIDKWREFIQSNRVDIPTNFNENQWSSFQERKQRRRRRMITMLSAAASLIILISIGVNNLKSNEQSDIEKRKLLSEAIGMFDEVEQREMRQSIFYENEMIIVYTVSE